MGKKDEGVEVPSGVEEGWGLFESCGRRMEDHGKWAGVHDPDAQREGMDVDCVKAQRLIGMRERKHEIVGEEC